MSPYEENVLNTMSYILDERQKEQEVTDNITGALLYIRRIFDKDWISKNPRDVLCDQTLSDEECMSYTNQWNQDFAKFSEYGLEHRCDVIDLTDSVYLAIDYVLNRISENESEILLKTDIDNYYEELRTEAVKRVVTKSQNYAMLVNTHQSVLLGISTSEMPKDVFIGGEIGYFNPTSPYYGDWQDMVSN